MRLSYAEGRFPIVRRRTGGGSLSLDPGSLCLIAAFPHGDGRPQRLARWVERFGAALADALQAAGIACRFDTPNDLVHDGRKFASVFVAIEREVVLCEAVVAVTLDVEELLKTLRLPLEKLSEAGLTAARARFAPLGERIPPHGIAALPQTLAASLARLAGQPPQQVEPPAAISRMAPPLEAAAPADLAVFLKTAGGVLYLDLELAADQTVRGARFSGAVQAGEPGLFSRLAQALVGRPVTALESALDLSIGREPDLLHIERDDLVYLGRLAAGRHWFAEHLGIAQANQVTVFSPRREEDLEGLLGAIDTVLLPYCAKPAWCKWRHRDGCPECGHCAVGEAYGLARERGLPVTTITNYEHLRAVLADMAAGGTRAFLGVCCTDFFLKRDYAFIEAGIAALFLDIGGETCYTLRAEEDAYAGQFTAEAVMDAALFRQVLSLRDHILKNTPEPLAHDTPAAAPRVPPHPGH